MFEPDGPNEQHEASTWQAIFGPYVELARTALRGLRELPLKDFAHQEQLAFLGEVGPLRSELESLLAEGLLVVERSGASVAEHGLSAQKWMSGCTGDSKSVSRRSLMLGRTRRDFPLFAQAVEDGRISVDHLHVLGAAMNPRVRHIMQAIESDLLEAAATHTVEQWRKELRAMIDYADQDGKEPEQPVREDEATVIFDESGRLSVRGEFYGAAAVTIYDLINAEVTRQLKAAKNEHDELGIERPSPKALRGRALSDILQRGGVVGERRRGQTDAVLVLDPQSELHPIRTLDGHDVDPVTAAVLLCDSKLSPLYCASDGHPLRYGRTRRLASLPQHWALAVRDGGCVFPGCDVPASWCQAHHLITWKEGKGPTNIDNLVLLCQRHHGYVHSNEWDLVPNHPVNRNPQGVDTEPHRTVDSTEHDAGHPVDAYTLIHVRSQRKHRIMTAQTRHRRSSPGAGRGSANGVALDDRADESD